MTSDIGLIGLGVMGQNLALNFADHGATVSVYNRTTSVTDEFAAEEGDRSDIVPHTAIEDLVAALERPRRIVLMVSAGRPVDAVIDQLPPEEGDIIIDGGNSLYTDTIQRSHRLEGRILFVSCGISGGDAGAHH